jgi:hypothetical protein
MESQDDMRRNGASNAGVIRFSRSTKPICIVWLTKPGDPLAAASSAGDSAGTTSYGLAHPGELRRFSDAVATRRGSYRNVSKKLSCARAWLAVPKFLRRGIGSSGHRLLRKSERKVTPMTVTGPNLIEIKLERLIDDMRLLRSQMIAFDRHLKGLEAYLKPSEPSEQQPESKARAWFVAAASATARTVLFAVGAATGAALLYLGT